MVQNCVKLVVPIKKKIFIIYNMPNNNFYETIFNGVHLWLIFWHWPLSWKWSF